MGRNFSALTVFAARVGERSDDGGVRAAAGERRRARARAGGRRALVGKDTRLSGYMFESALEAGFVAAGVDVLPDRTAADARHRLPDAALRAAASASSSAPRTTCYDDNGIKFFDAVGQQARPTRLEERIEALLDEPALTRESMQLGRAHACRQVARRVPGVLRLDDPGAAPTSSGLKIVIDCAHGAAYKVAPRVLDGPRRGDHPDRLLAERPQHQPALRFDRAGAAAAHRVRRAGRRRHRARRRRRPAGDGGPPRPRWWTATSCCTSSRCDRHAAGRTAGARWSAR